MSEDEVKKKLREMIQKDIQGLCSKMAKLGFNALVHVADEEMCATQIVHRHEGADGKEGGVISEIRSLVMEGARLVLNLEAAPLPMELVKKLTPMLNAIMSGGPGAIDSLQIIEVRDGIDEVMQQVKKQRKKSALDDLDDMLGSWGSKDPVKA